MLRNNYNRCYDASRYQNCKRNKSEAILNSTNGSGDSGLGGEATIPKLRPRGRSKSSKHNKGSSSSSRSSSSSKSRSESLTKVTRGRSESKSRMHKSRVKDADKRRPKNSNRNREVTNDKDGKGTESLLQRIDSLLTSLVDQEKRKNHNYGVNNRGSSYGDANDVQTRYLAEDRRTAFRPVTTTVNRKSKKPIKVNSTITSNLRMRSHSMSKDFSVVHTDCFTDKKPYHPSILKDQTCSVVRDLSCQTPSGKRKQMKAPADASSKTSNTQIQQKRKATNDTKVVMKKPIRKAGSVTSCDSVEEELEGEDNERLENSPLGQYSDDFEVDDTCYGTDEPPDSPNRKDAFLLADNIADSAADLLNNKEDSLVKSGSQTRQEKSDSADGGSVDSAYTGSRGGTPEISANRMSQLVVTKSSPLDMNRDNVAIDVTRSPRTRMSGRRTKNSEDQCSTKMPLSHLKRQLLLSIRDSGLYSDANINNHIESYIRRAHTCIPKAELSVMMHEVRTLLGVGEENKVHTPMDKYYNQDLNRVSILLDGRDKTHSMTELDTQLRSSAISSATSPSIAMRHANSYWNFSSNQSATETVADQHFNFDGNQLLKSLPEYPQILNSNEVIKKTHKSQSETHPFSTSKMDSLNLARRVTRRKQMTEDVEWARTAVASLDPSLFQAAKEEAGWSKSKPADWSRPITADCLTPNAVEEMGEWDVTEYINGICRQFDLSL